MGSMMFRVPVDPWLLKTVLRDEWGYKGPVLTDVGTPDNNLILPQYHHWVTTLEESLCRGA